MDRRLFIRTTGLAGFGALAYPSAGKPGRPGPSDDDRMYTRDVMTRIAHPLLEALSQGRLKATMPVEAREGQQESRRQVTHLEAFGRLLAGIAPWLELGSGKDVEGRERAKYIDLTLRSLEKAINPGSPDFMNFSGHPQALVDAAFLAHGLLRAPSVLLKEFDTGLKDMLVQALTSSRVIKPPYNNWLLFAGMVEALLMKLGEKADRMRIDFAVKKHLEWYKGDGWYGDGPDFHWDYYNSFVIQPMLLDIVKVLVEEGHEDHQLFDHVLQKAQRYALIQERLISPEATYPPVGRSLAYRFGAFQTLSQLSLSGQLPEDLPPAQVRSALTAVIRRQIEADGTFDREGWLRIGFYGHQPEAGEAYISTGSLYLCSVGLLHLGLPPEDPFWTGPFMEWTSKKAWSGKFFPIDHAW